MSKNKFHTLPSAVETKIVEVKSKFDAEYRRFSIKSNGEPQSFENFKALVEQLHGLVSVQFIIRYIDPRDHELLNINNDDNFGLALKTAQPKLRIIVQRKEYVEYGVPKPPPLGWNMLSMLTRTSGKPKPPPISNPHDFHKVSDIIDVDIVPETHRRVRLLKHGSDKLLGFYIQECRPAREKANGIKEISGIYISRMVPGGLAESTGLLAVNDEVIEVNGIEVAGKTLDQVTDMMVANRSHLIITTKPANQYTSPLPRRGSHHTYATDELDEDDQDDIAHFTGITLDYKTGSARWTISAKNKN